MKAIKGRQERSKGFRKGRRRKGVSFNSTRVCINFNEGDKDMNTQRG
jgi:hypothetical protein